MRCGRWLEHRGGMIEHRMRSRSKSLSSLFDPLSSKSLPVPVSPFPFGALVHKALSGLDRAVPFDLLSSDSAARFIDARSRDDITWARLGQGMMRLSTKTD